MNKKLFALLTIVALSLMMLLPMANASVSLPEVAETEEKDWFDPPPSFRGNYSYNVYVSWGNYSSEEGSRGTWWGEDIVTKINHQEWFTVSGTCQIDAYNAVPWTYNIGTFNFL